MILEVLHNNHSMYQLELKFALFGNALFGNHNFLCGYLVQWFIYLSCRFQYISKN